MKRKEAPSPASTPHLAERVEKLSIKRQEIIRPIPAHPREYVLLSVRAMAARLHTDAATSAGRILHLVRSGNKQDLVIAISFRRGLRQTVEGAQQARARGAYCVAISDTYISPLARECDELFLASIESTSFGASYAAPISLLNAILAAVGQYRRTQTLAMVKEIAEEQRKGSRWHDI